MSVIEVAIPKEIREYEAKLIGGFTTRKLICASVAVGCSAAVYFLQKNILGIESPSGFLCFLAAFPGAMFIFKPYGLKMEVFLKAAFVDNVLAPKKRIYKVENPIIEKIGFLDEEEELILKEIPETNSDGTPPSKKEINQIKRENKKTIERNKKEKAIANKPIPLKKLPEELKPYK